MRWAMPQPCMGSRARVLRMRRSSVPCRMSVEGILADGGMFPSAFDNRMLFRLVECQGEKIGTRE